MKKIELTKEKIRKTNQEKYGKDYYTQTEQFKEKSKKTNLAKYGVENPSQAEEVKEKKKKTNLRKRGVEYSFQSKEVKEEIKRTNLKKYGVENPFQSEEVKEKIKNTNLRKRGVEYPTQSKKVKEKIRRNNLAKYGVENPSQLEEVKEKRRKTNLKKYGVEYPTQSKKVKEKIRRNNLAKYGVENPSQLKEVKEKAKNTNLDKYGVPVTSQAEEVKEKMRKTNQEKYGKDYYVETEKCKSANRNNRISKINKEFSKKLIKNNVKNTLEYEEFDIKIDGKNIVIDIDPTPTHNINVGYKKIGEGKKKTYHYEKSKKAENMGLFCIHIFDWDNEDKIIAMLKPKKRIYAKSCTINDVDNNEARLFLDKYHIQNSCLRQSIRLGLYYHGELVYLMTFNRLSNKGNYKLLRICPNTEYNVIGGSNMLFKYFLDTYNPKLVLSYCDKSKFSGNLYDELGFYKKSESKPSKYWCKRGKYIADKTLKQKGLNEILNINPNTKKNIETIMREEGFLEVYDCGQDIYIWKK